MGVWGCVEGTHGENLVIKVSKTFLPWPTPPRKHPHVAIRECEKQTSKTNAVLRLPEKQKKIAVHEVCREPEQKIVVREVPSVLPFSGSRGL